MFYGPPRALCCAGDAASFRVSSDGRALGTIRDDAAALTCCQGRMFVGDPSGRDVLRLGPVPLCTCAALCPCVAEEIIPVFESAGASPVAELRRPRLACHELFGLTNRFVVTFDGVADPDRRRLLFAAGLAWDLCYWEQK